MKDSDETETPPELYRELALRYGPPGRGEYDLDAAASHENALADAYYTQDGYYIRDDAPVDPDDPPPPGVREVLVAKLSDADGLAGGWGWNTYVWVNPPYSDIRPWVAKAWREVSKPDGTRPRSITMLLPARTDAPWWRDLVEPYRAGSARPQPPPAGSEAYELVVEFRPRVEFLRNGQRIQSRDPKTGELRYTKSGQPKLSGARFGVAVLVWRRRAVAEVTGVNASAGLGSGSEAKGS